MPRRLCLLVLATAAQGRSDFQWLIPNGANVRFEGELWAGVGHFDQYGGGPKNPFGIDFQLNGFAWTESLCRKDSDGDGQTNGQELGDPNCRWTPGATPERVTDITHPGLSKLTANQSECFRELNKKKTQQATCPPKAADIQELTMTMGGYPIPSNQVTTYICKKFDLPTDQKYHITHTKPLIDPNTAAYVHHYTLNGCHEMPDLSGYGEYFPCEVAMSCNDALAEWSLGGGNFGETCLPADLGVAFGPGSRLKGAVMEVHYENGLLHVGKVDNTGVQISVTPTLRPKEKGQLIVGKLDEDSDFKIEAGYEKAYITSECPSDCTSTWPHPIYIFQWASHMHTVGKRMWVEHYKRQADGSLVLQGNIGKTGCFTSTLPQETILDEPVRVDPGDVLVTTCEFDTRTRSAVTKGGDASKDEMCYAYLDYYPKLNEHNYCFGSPDKDAGDIIPSLKGTKVQTAVCGLTPTNFSSYVGSVTGDVCETLCKKTCAQCEDCWNLTKKFPTSTCAQLQCCDCWDTASGGTLTGMPTPCLSNVVDSCKGCWDPDTARPVTTQVSWGVPVSCTRSCTGGYCEITAGGSWQCVRPQVAAAPAEPSVPTFSPPSGTAVSAGARAVITATNANHLCYTTDGSTPVCNASALGFDSKKCVSPALEYSAPVSIADGMTLKAVGCGLGGLVGSVGTATYTIGAKSWPTSCDCSSGSAPYEPFTGVSVEWCASGGLGAASTGSLWLRLRVSDTAEVAGLSGTGYVGIGIGGGTMAAGADIMILDKAGGVSDRSATATGLPPLDATQNVIARSHSASPGGGWTMEVERPLGAGDGTDKAIVPGPMDVMAAFGIMGGNNPGYHATNKAPGGRVTFCAVAPPTSPPTRAATAGPAAASGAAAVSSAVFVAFWLALSALV